MPQDQMQKISSLLITLVEGQERQNELLENIIEQSGSQQRQQLQQLSDLESWKSQNPRLAKLCADASDVLCKVHMDFLEKAMSEIVDKSDDMIDSDYVFNEFIDSFGPRLLHLNGILQIVGRLGSIPSSATNQE